MSTESHKTVQGTLTVLASRSLLVDLRVGERRRGQKGVEVMLVDPSGTRTCFVADRDLRGTAPECSVLSSRTEQEAHAGNAPDVLLEDIQRRCDPGTAHQTADVPGGYGSLSSLATFVQVVVQLTLHTDAAKCVLMANDPQADIELLLPATGPPKLRMRVSRQDASAEIATHRISEDGGEEWTKKVLKIPDINGAPCILPAECEALGANEQAAVDELERFLSLCRFLESPAAPPPNSSCTASSFPQIHISRRPPKFATSVECDLASVEGIHSSVTWCEEASSETRFRAGVGWCLRQKSKYKIMFFDGAVLEVDVDQECAKLTVGGQTTK
ncbi:unnamed protein product [Mycena citricolor]|uniref:Cryptic POLO box 2 (CPB2) domain-containing protein n=1 Tax=Mycena citricolor TaxID=2018698 RepID=A0AAD2HXT3_9AGAR|nr:unnamed protein product [Mycena citricolor]